MQQLARPSHKAGGSVARAALPKVAAPQNAEHRNGRANGRALHEDDTVPSQSQGVSESQTMAQRRELRAGYRDLIENLSNQKQELSAPTREATLRLNEAIDRGDELFQNVKMAREAALDSESLVIISELVSTQSNKLVQGSSMRDIGSFTEKVAAILRTEGWDGLGKRSMRFSRIVPAATFMYGPLDTKQEEKKQRKKPAPREKVAAAISPEEVKERNNSIPESSKRAEQMYNILKKQKDGSDYFKFILDPTSYSRTVENVFHSAFLIKDGLAAMTVGGDHPSFKAANAPTDADTAQGVHKHQCIIKFDYQMYQKLKEKFQADRPMVPPHSSGPTPEEIYERQRQAAPASQRRSGDNSSQPTHPVSQPHSQPKASSQRSNRRIEDEEDDEPRAKRKAPELKTRIKKDPMAKRQIEEEDDGDSDADEVPLSRNKRRKSNE